jgi:2',3'-cyclic-nucleotide 2'-phosphodiesterase (5'-nucleotidase family)
VRLTILHTNDIHGREKQIARIATLVRRERERSPHRVLYLDAGDVEDTTNRLSSLTKGSAMHRLLSLTTCDAHTVGNASWLRYGPAVLADHARAASYPLLLANFGGVGGVLPSVLLGDVGLIGVTAPLQDLADDVDWGFDRLDILESVRGEARGLRARGAKLVILLSHLGLHDPAEPWDDRRIAPELQHDVDVIVGAHTHDLLPEGECIGRVLVAQAGSFGEHLGRITVDGDSIVATVETIGDDVEPYAAVAEEASRIEAEVADSLAEQVGEVDVPLDAAFVAEVLRRRMDADVGLYPDGQTLGVVPPGSVTRGALWEALESAANPGVTSMSGARLRELIARGRDPEFAAATPRPLRGRPRGYLAVTGLDPDDIDPTRDYVVAATDWELGSYGGYVPANWELDVRYDFPTIVREAVEEHLRRS